MLRADAPGATPIASWTPPSAPPCPPAADVAADAYLAAAGAGATVIAGFPWFTDWGRDTFIAMRGLLIARGRLAEAAAILRAWAAHVSEGMLPNRFPDGGAPPEYNAADASLWFVVAVARADRGRRRPGGPARGGRRHPGRLHRRHPLRHRLPTRRTGCCAPACPGSSSPGWTPRSATG